MIPIRDAIPTRRVPVVNYTLIALNILVFIAMWLAGAGSEDWILGLAMIPANIQDGLSLGDAADVFTSMFMHAGLAHLAGNLLYLWIFGDNIENRLGHSRYLLVYFVCGIIASLSHVFSTLMLNQSSLVPSLGASGAISGVLGGYLLLYPTRKVHAILLWYMVSIPALLALGLWIAFQVISGLGMLGGDESGGVAYAAHIGGFIAGFLLIKFFDPVKRVVTKEPFIRRIR